MLNASFDVLLLGKFFEMPAGTKSAPLQQSSLHEWGKKNKSTAAAPPSANITSDDTANMDVTPAVLPDNGAYLLENKRLLILNRLCSQPFQAQRAAFYQ